MSRFKIALILLLSLVVTSSQQVSADIVSLEKNYVAGQADVVGQLNRDRIALTNGVNNIRGKYSGGVQTAGQIKADTIAEENMYDDANPRVFLKELFISNTDGNNGIVSYGLEWGTSANLTSTLSAGVGYTMGYRIYKDGTDTHLFTASKWTYCFLKQDGTLSFDERNIGVSITTADYPANAQPLAKVITDATSVTSVVDMRKTKFTLESFDSVYDDATESTLKNILVARGNSYKSGAMLKYMNASQYTVTAGAAMINGEARDRIAFNANAAWPVATNATDDGLDSGSSGDATYYVYLVADAPNQRAYTVVHSLSDANPSGKTNYLKIGELRRNKGAISKDSVISYVGGETLSEPVRACKGWINLKGTGTAAIRDSYNVSSITDNGTGDYTITWATAFLNENYVIAGVNGDDTTPTSFVNIKGSGGLVSTYARLDCRDNSGVAKDFDVVCIVAFGNR